MLRLDVHWAYDAQGMMPLWICRDLLRGQLLIEIDFQLEAGGALDFFAPSFAGAKPREAENEDD